MRARARRELATISLRARSILALALTRPLHASTPQRTHAPTQPRHAHPRPHARTLAPSRTQCVLSYALAVTKLLGGWSTTPQRDMLLVGFVVKFGWWSMAMLYGFWVSPRLPNPLPVLAR